MIIKHKIVILSSGFGSNLQSIINQLHEVGGIRVEAIISDNASRSVKRGLENKINTIYLPCNSLLSKEQYDERLAKIVSLFVPDLIVLSGFMRVLTPVFINCYPNKIINIHPSLLPKYKGLNTHQRVLNSGDRIHGTTVHYVTEKLDSGQIIVQEKCEITASDTVSSLKDKIKKIEHNLYPRTIRRLLAISQG